MPGLAAVSTGTCTGEGKCIPAQIHDTTVCSQPPCPPANSVCKVLPLAKMISTCHWPPTPLTHLNPGTAVKTVKFEGQIPLVDGDQLILHKSDCVNIVKNMWPTPQSGCTTPKEDPCSCSLLTKEDNYGAGHPRTVVASGKNVLVEGKPLACIGDKLGPPCTATIGTGCKTITVGKVK